MCWYLVFVMLLQVKWMGLIVVCRFVLQWWRLLRLKFVVYVLCVYFLLFQLFLQYMMGFLVLGLQQCESDLRMCFLCFLVDSLNMLFVLVLDMKLIRVLCLLLWLVLLYVLCDSLYGLKVVLLRFCLCQNGWLQMVCILMMKFIDRCWCSWCWWCGSGGMNEMWLQRMGVWVRIVYCVCIVSLFVVVMILLLDYFRLWMGWFSSMLLFRCLVRCSGICCRLLMMCLLRMKLVLMRFEYELVDVVMSRDCSRENVCVGLVSIVDLVVNVRFWMVLLLLVCWCSQVFQEIEFYLVVFGCFYGLLGLILVISVLRILVIWVIFVLVFGVMGNIFFVKWCVWLLGLMYMLLFFWYWLYVLSLSFLIVFLSVF